MAGKKGRMLLVAAVIVTAAFFAAALSHSYLDAEGWHREEIEVSKTWGSNVAVAVDESDRVHIAYHGFDGSLYAVRYAVRSGGSWDVHTAAYATKDIYDLRLNLRDDATVHIHWTWEDRLFYAHGEGGAFEVVSVQIENMSSGCIAMDSEGGVHALCTLRQYETSSYLNYWQYRYQYWTVSSGEWVLEWTSDVPEDTGHHRIVALLVHDQEDPLALSWYRHNLSGMDLLRTVTVMPTGLELDDTLSPFNSDYRLFDALFDSHGTMHMLMYRDSTPPVLQLWTETGEGDGYDYEFVDHAGDSLYTRGSMLIDHEDTVYVTYTLSYAGVAVEQLRIAERTADGWVIQTVSWASAFAYDRPVLAIDSEGVYHLAKFVYEDTRHYVGYANSDSGEVFMEALQTAGILTALAVAVTWPTGFAVIRWHRRRKAERQKLEDAGLHDI